MRSVCSAGWRYDGTTLKLVSAEGIKGVSWDPSGALKFTTDRPVGVDCFVRVFLEPQTNAPAGLDITPIGAIVDNGTFLARFSTPGGPAIAGGSVEVVQIDGPFNVLPGGAPPPTPVGPPVGPGASGFIIWRGGAVPSGNVVGTAAQLKAALALAPVPAVYVDSSGGACTVLLADGQIDFKGLTTLYPFDVSSAGIDQVDINDGGQLRNLRGVSGGLTLQGHAGASGVRSIDWDRPGGACAFRLSNGATIRVAADSTISPVGITGPDTLELVVSGRVQLDNSGIMTVPVIDMRDTSGLTLTEYNDGLVTNGANNIATAIGAFLNNLYDASSKAYAGTSLLGTSNYDRLETTPEITFFQGAVAPAPVGGLQVGDVWFDTATVPPGSPAWWNGAAWVRAVVA